MAQLTGDQVIAIKNSSTFIDRIKGTLLLKAEYWKENPTASRASVNRQMQKRKRLAKNILSTTWADSYGAQVGQYWLSYYQTSSPVLDGNGIPTYAEIFAGFDPTFDFFAGYLAGDENEQEIDW
jgi:hypothetical protein